MIVLPPSMMLVPFGGSHDHHGGGFIVTKRKDGRAPAFSGACAEDRFWGNTIVVGPEDCWPWTRGLTKGYGHLRDELATRKAYRLANGDPGHHYILHRCDNPPCINPRHLFPGTQADNMRDMAAKGRAMTGERCPGAKLTRAIVEEIRRSNERVGVLAKRLGVSSGLVSMIRSGKRWRHVA